MITSRSRYGLKIMMDLAQRYDEHQQRRQDVAHRQGIPSDYMDHILASLREAGLVESIRGRNGGLRLAKDPSAISAWDIFSAVEMNMSPVACLDSDADCFSAAGCISKGAWEDIFASLRASLSAFRLHDLVAKQPRSDYNLPVIDKDLVQECKAPSRAPGGLS